MTAASVLHPASVRRRARQAAQNRLWDSEALWRGTANRAAVRAHREHPPVLRDEARRCLSELRRDGVTVTTLEALTGEADLLPALREHAAALEELRREQLAEHRRLVEQGRLVEERDKVYVLQLLGDTRPVVDPDGPLARFALHEQLVGVVDSCFGLRTRVADLNVWRTLPSGPTPVASQLWHRDVREDRKVVKAFVYLEPVGEGAGPFRYARGTQPGGPVELDPRTEFDGLNHRVPEGPEADALQEHELVCTGDAGTVVVADTLGYHRGGWASTDTRLAVQVRYASRAASRNNRLGTPDWLGPEQVAHLSQRWSYDPAFVGPLALGRR